ncbi:MAG: D-alanine--D-alanine ligase, partial [Actinomycetia bacterium]|nr:D-alanine--D-alanine ligase [Actinomycetes bacterium]
VVGNGEPMGWRFLYFNVKKTGTFSKKMVDISDPSYQGLMADCEKIYRMFLPMDYGTFDVRINNQGKHYFLECNADATLHPERTLAQCCALNGISFSEMIKIILHSAMERRNLL